MILSADFSLMQDQPYNLISSESAKIIANAIENRSGWQEFSSFGIGLGAILAGGAGLKIILDWWEQKQIVRRINNLNRKYPESRFNKNYKFVATKKVRGKWYLLDFKTKKRHWIRNYETVRDMGWEGKLKSVSETTLARYTPGITISTRKFYF